MHLENLKFYVLEVFLFCTVTTQVLTPFFTGSVKRRTGLKKVQVLQMQRHFWKLNSWTENLIFKHSAMCECEAQININKLHQNPFSVKVPAAGKSPTCELSTHLTVELKVSRKVNRVLLEFKSQSSWCQNLTEFSRFPRGYTLAGPIWSDEHLLEPVLEQEEVSGGNPAGPAGNKWAERCLGLLLLHGHIVRKEPAAGQLPTLLAAAVSRARHVLQGHGPYWPSL